MIYAATYSKTFSDRREETKFQHDLGLRLLRYAVKREHNIDINDKKICKRSGGKPYFEDLNINFSISHCSGLVCCVISDKEIGIDAEPVDRNFKSSTLKRVFNEKEIELVNSSEDTTKAFMTFWTLKESIMKLTGQGIAMGAKSIEMTENNGTFTSNLPDIISKVFYEPDGFVISVSGEDVPQKIVFVSKDELFSEQ